MFQHRRRALRKTNPGAQGLAPQGLAQGTRLLVGVILVGRGLACCCRVWALGLLTMCAAWAQQAPLETASPQPNHQLSPELNPQPGGAAGSRTQGVAAPILVGQPGVETDSSRKLPRAAARPQPDPQDSTCWLQIARYYDNPWGDSTLFKPDSVLYYLRLGAEARHPESQYVLGIYLARGTLGPRQPKAGINWLTQAADAGSARACQALMELLGPDPGRSFLPPAQQVPQDLPRSFEYALRGAALNNPECAFQVAHKYQKGEGTPQNDSMAIHWMDHAARHHQDIRAQLELGDWFFYGKTNLGRQHERALEYYDLARNHHYRSVDQYAHAEAKAHDIRRFPELIYNVRTLSLFLLPDNAFVVPFEH